MRGSSQYMSLGGVEIINSARAYAGAQAHLLPIRCEGCPTLAIALDDPEYTGNPTIDDAPWIDPTMPESRRFLGVLGLDATGLTADPVNRVTTALIGDGSAIGTLRRTQREIEYRVLLVALDDASLSYGLSWLASALRGGVCANVCGAGSELCFLPGCPTDAVQGARQLRHIYQVGLLDGLSVEDRFYLSQGADCTAAPAGAGDQCCTGDDMTPVVAEVVFTVVAGNPHIYRAPIMAADGAWLSLAGGDLLTNYDPDARYDECVEPFDCTADPTCPPPPLPPQVPVPVNACYTRGPMTARRLWLRMDAAMLPAWSEMVPTIELFTGSDPLRRLLVRFYPNPTGTDCSRLEDACASCTALGVNYLPARSTFLLDGTTSSATVDCSTTTRTGTASPQLYGPQGTVFTWPVFECPTTLCVEVIALASSVTSSTELRFGLVPRSDAA